MSQNFKVVFHDFLDDYESFISQSESFTFKDKYSPMDGVTYPNICEDFPESIRAEVISKLSGFFGAEIKDPKMVVRLSTEGARPPHLAHNDSVMAKYTFMLYLNKPEHCKGGTWFVDHVDEPMSELVYKEEQHDIWKRDTNNPEKWKVIDSIGMQTNKGVLFSSNLMHMTAKPYGFGNSIKDGRLVLICFFDL